MTTGPSTGPVVVVDGDTGNPIVTVEPSPAFQYAGASFSPDDAYLALSDSNSATTRIIDTTTWATVRIVSGTNLRWSPDSTELAARQLTAPTTISIYSATDPLADRTVAIPGQSCSQVSDWSSTGRVALTCGFGGVITASVSGPLDVRVLVAAPTIPTPGVLRGVVPPKFSPSGALLAFGEVNVTSFSPFAFDSSRIVIAPDAEGATFTPMTDPAPAGLAVGALGWTGTAAPPPPPPTTTTTTTLPTTTTTPTTPHPASALDAGTYHACAVVTGGAVKCWGSNESGELGNGASGPSAGSTTPVTVTGLTGATSVARGMYHSCALIDDGTVTCWGENGAGQLGNGTTNDSSVPVTVPGITGATAITSASGATCVIVAGGAVKCWGISYYGELGTTNSSAVPVDVAGVTGATAIAGGAFHMCALVANGAVSCWGRNYQGQLGNGHSGGGVDSTAPVSVVGITGATAISAHANEHTCAVLADTTVECWGNNSVGQLGNGTSTDSPVPVPVTGVTGVTAINSGSNHTCAVVAGGTVKCWGVNGSGQLGNGGSGSNSNLAVNVVGLTGAVAMAGGNMFTCAVTVDGHVKCWGTNSDYGSGPSAFSSLTPFNVPGIP